MAAEVQQGYGERFFADINTRLRDIEEKQAVLRDRMLLVSNSFVKERDSNFDALQDLKQQVASLTLENKQLKELVLRIGEMVNRSARKEELMILQRQFDLFRE